MIRALRLVALVIGGAATAHAECERTHCVGLHLHAVPEVATPEWIAAQVAVANAQFAALDVGFTITATEALPAEVTHVVTRADRDAISKDRLALHVINVYLVSEVDDVDDPASFVRGVLWHHKADKYIILSAVAPDRVLAHELGHYFGLPHSTYAVSIMNKSKREKPPMEERRFADEELGVMKAQLKQTLAALK